MTARFEALKQFLTTDIWRIGPDDVSALRYFFYNVIKILYLSIKFFTTKRIMDYASALTYSSLLAVVPICAVVFAIARGFGYSKYIEVWFRGALESQPQAAETIIGFVNSYLVHTKSGVFLGIGLLFMLWTIIMLTRKTELTFNDIWNVKSERTIVRTFVDYIAMFFIIPIMIVLTSGLSIYIATIADKAHAYTFLGTAMEGVIALMPYVIMSIVFILFYVFMPNTNVKLRATIVPGILSGFAMQLLQYVYINSQIFLSSYNAIYGSFAALPLFMLWLQLSWTICLFGAELCYTNQNLEKFDLFTDIKKLSYRYKLFLCLILLNKVCKRFALGLKPYTAKELKMETNVPIRVVQDLLDDLVEADLMSKSIMIDGEQDPVYQPTTSPEHISVGMTIDRLEALGQWNVDMNIREEVEDSDAWQTIYAIHRNYLNSLRKVAVMEL